MATVLDDDKVYVSFPITKFEETADGHLLVYGKATDGSVDSDEQICDPEWSAKALSSWMESGPNVRVMHNPKLYPAGAGVSLEIDRDGDSGHWLRSKVVEPIAKDLVRHKGLRAYSIGIAKPVIERDFTGKAPGGIIKGGEIFEVSLVDRPANKNCGITLVKGVDAGGVWEYGDLDELLRTARADEATKAAKPDSDAKPDGDAEDAADGGTDEAAEDEVDAEKAAASGDAADAADADSEGGQDRDGAAEADAETDGGDADGGDAEKSAWVSERAGWLAREPKMAGAAVSGTTFLAKRAEWQRWQAEGESGGLVDDGYPLWVAKRAKAAPADGDAEDAADGGADEAAEGEGGDVDAGKGAGSMCADCGGDGTGAGKCMKCGKTFGAETVKASKDCPECGTTHHADSKLRTCSNCGADLPHADKAADGEPAAEKGRPAGTKPAGEHREPDGDAVEAFEADAGMATDRDAQRDKVPASVKADYTTVRTHDALCAAYHWDTVADEYPSLKGVGDVLDARFLGEVTKAAGGVDVGAIDAAVLADARAGLHKSFADMYPTAHPTPGSVTPGQFGRPYVSAGHAPLSAGSATPRIPAGSHVPHADDFTRGPLVEGHQAPPPGSSGDNNPVSSVSSGAVRTYYTRATRDAARNAMQAMHDHIATTFPDMCPLSGSHTPLPANGGDTNRPTPNHVPDSAKAPGEKTAEPTLGKVKKAKKLLKAHEPLDVDAIVKAAVTEAVAEVTATYQPKIAAMQAEIDELGAQPDPRMAPARGVVGTAATKATGPADIEPVEKVNLVEKAQAHAATEKAQYAAYLQRMTGHTDPSTREQAEAALAQLLSS